MTRLIALTFPALILLFLSTSQSASTNRQDNSNHISDEHSDTAVKFLHNKYATDSTGMEIQRFINAHRHCGTTQIESSEHSNCVQPDLSQNIRYFGNLSTTCAQILYLIDNPACCSIPIYSRAALHSSDHEESQGREPKFLQQQQQDGTAVELKKKPSDGEVWGYGILFVTLISMCSVAGVSVMPFMGKKLYKNILTMLIGLAVGSLVGSSLFHLIPQAYGYIEPDGHHDYLYTSLVICSGIWMFFMVERFLKIIMEYRDRKDGSWKREKMSSVFSSTPENSTISMLVENGHDKSNPTDRMNNSLCSQTTTGVIYECQEQAIKASFGHQEKPRCHSGHEHVKFEQGKDSVIATVAWMIIFGDGLHNFIDGLSIGAAFNESILTGVSISVAVLCEELPHELGDFAVLLNAGMSVRQALMYNFMSACTCYLGMAVGILLGEIEASQYIFGLAGGMFLYISLVDMVPEMNEVAEESSKVSIGAALKVLLLQNIGIFMGISTLFVLAMYQDNIKF